MANIISYFASVVLHFFISSNTLWPVIMFKFGLNFFFGNYRWHVCGPYKYSWCTHRSRCTGPKCGTFSQKTHANTTVNLIWFSPCNEMPTSISYYFFPWTPHILRLLLFQCTSFITLCRYFWLLDSIFRVDFGACFLVVVSHIYQSMYSHGISECHLKKGVCNRRNKWEKRQQLQQPPRLNDFDVFISCS